MIDETHTVTINRPVNEVFDFVADPSNEPEWHYDVKEILRPKNGPLQLGETFEWVVKAGSTNTYEVEITGFEPNRFIELTARKGPVLPVLTHTFQPDRDRTRYTRRVRFETKGLLRVLAPIMNRISNPNRRWAENLKTLLEG